MRNRERPLPTVAYWVAHSTPDRAQTTRIPPTISPVSWPNQTAEAEPPLRVPGTRHGKNRLRLTFCGGTRKSSGVEVGSRNVGIDADERERPPDRPQENTQRPHTYHRVLFVLTGWISGQPREGISGMSNSCKAGISGFFWDVNPLFCDDSPTKATTKRFPYDSKRSCVKCTRRRKLKPCVQSKCHAALFTKSR